MIDEGLGAGVSGILNLQGQSNVKFVGDVLGWDQLLGVGVFDDAGRADSIWGNKLPLSAGGTITLKGMTNLDGQPTPNDYRGERGPLVLQQNTGVTETVTVMVTNSKFTKSTKEDQLWDFIHVCSIVAAPAMTGWGGTNAAATQSYGDKELWAGMSKTLDPQTLQSGASQRWRIWGIGDNDAAEKTKIDSHLAALVAPYSGMKLRPCTFTRLSTNVCISETTWGLTTTSEDVINASSETTTDPNILTSHAVTAAFNTTPPVSGSLIERETTLKEYNDNMVLHTTAYGVRDTRDDVEMPGTVTSNDPYDLEDAATVTKQTTSSTPPATPAAPLGLHVATDTEQLDRINWKHVFHYANSTSKQKVEFAGSSTQVDPSALTDNYEETIVNQSSTPPATPTTGVSGTKLRRRISRRIGGTPEEWSHQFIFDRRTTQDDIEMDGSSISVDPSTLEDRTEITLVITSSTPAPPSTPAGLQLIDTRSKQRHDTKWAHTFIYEQTTNQQKLEYAKTYDDVDPQGLDSRSAIAAMDATPGTPAGLVLRSTRTDPVTPDHDLTVVEAGERTTADDRIFGKTKVSIDRGSIKTRQESYTAELITTGASFVAPSAPSAGMVCTDYFDVPETNAASSNKSIRVYVWSLATNIEQLQQPRYSNEVDPNGLDTTVRSATVWDGTSAPADPALTGIRSGLKLVSKTDIGLPSHPTTLIRVFLHEKNDSIDKRVLPHTWTLADPSNITSNGEVAALNSTPSVPGGYKSRGLTGFYQNGTDLLNVTKFALRSEADDITHGDTVAHTRVFEGTTLDNATLLASSSAANVIAASILTTYKNNTTFEGATVRKLHDGLAEIILHTRDDQIIVGYRFWGTGQQVIPAYWDGSDVYVFLGEVYKISTSLWYFELRPNYQRSGRGQLTIDRRVNGSSVNIFDNLFNTSNNSAFLGLGAGLVGYEGLADGATNILVSAPRVSRVTYGLSVDSNGFVDMSTISMGWQRTTTDISALTPFTWVTASDLGITATVLDQQDYSGLIA